MRTRRPGVLESKGGVFHGVGGDDNCHQVQEAGLILTAVLFFSLIFIYLVAPGLTCSIAGSSIFVATFRFFSCDLRTLSFGMWDLVPWSRMEPRPAALGAPSLSHWTTREVPWLLHLTTCSQKWSSQSWLELLEWRRQVGGRGGVRGCSGTELKKQ